MPTVHFVVWVEGEESGPWRVCCGGAYASREEAEARENEVFEELCEREIAFDGLRVASLNVQESLPCP